MENNDNAILQLQSKNDEISTSLQDTQSSLSSSIDAINDNLIEIGSWITFDHEEKTINGTTVSVPIMRLGSSGSNVSGVLTNS